MKSVIVLFVIFMSQTLIAQEVINLWTEQPPYSKPNSLEETVIESWGVQCAKNVTNPTLTVYRAQGDNSGRAMIILPGGGYELESIVAEGRLIAEYLSSKGIVAAVLKYRLPLKQASDKPHLLPITDARKAIALMKSMADDYGFNPSKVGIMGFSAGGHLATAVSVLTSEKQNENPDFSALIYPVTTLGDENQKWLEKSLFHRKMTNEEKKQYELVNNVTKLTPPAFLLHAYDDEVVPIEESLLYAKALTAAGQDVEVHYFANGGHGFGPGRPDDGTSQWLGLLANWIKRQSLTTGQNSIELDTGWAMQTGDNQAWANPYIDDSKWQAIEVGVPWEEAGHANYDGYAWYRIKFTVPEHWQQQDKNGLLSLSLGSIDDADVTYFNGEQVGATGSMPPDYKTAYYTRRFYRIPTRLVRWGKPNVIAVRVYDDDSNGGLYKGPITIQIPRFEDLIGIKFKFKNSNGIYFSPDPLAVTINIINHSYTGYELDAMFELVNDRVDSKRVLDSMKKTVHIDGKGEVSKTIEFTRPRPGFYHMVCTLNNSVKKTIVLGYEPEKIVSPLTRKADFDEFWNKRKQELAGVAPEFKVTKNNRSTDKVDVYLVEMQSYGNVKVRGWYTVPNKPGPHPAILSVPGYTSTMWPYVNRTNVATFALNPRGHGNSKDDVDPKGEEYMFIGFDPEHPEKYIYAGAYLDCLRAVDFLVSRPEIDASRIGVEGGSQGGGLSFATAALDSRIIFCAPDIPWLGDWVGYLETAEWAHDNYPKLFKVYPDLTFAGINRLLSYFDTLNMAEWITCPVLMSVGLQDDVCPARTSFAPYNAVKSKKDYRVYPFAGHGVWREHSKLKDEWMAKMLGIDKISEGYHGQSDDDGFDSVFDGQTLDGWYALPKESVSDWSVHDGVIVGSGSADRLSYLVWKDDRLKDFELKLRYRLPGKGNTGVEIRSQPDLTGKRPFEGYHADLGHVGIGPHILGAWDFHFAKRKEYPCPRGTRLVIDEDGKPHSSTIHGALTATDVCRHQWNDVRIIARGKHFQFFINGKLTSEFTDNSKRGRLDHGAIGLQIHDKGMRVEFKDIQLRRLAVTGYNKDFFSEQPIWSSGTAKSGGDGIARFIDFDRDGDLDFVTSAPNPKRWVLYRNQTGKLAKKPFWESRETTDCDHIDVLDFNHDGWMDLAATHESHCTLYLNQAGKFNVTPDWETGMIANANQIDFGDFDRDGDLDMVMAGGEPVNGVALFENTAGTPAQKVTRKLGHTEYAETVIYADFDGDGDLDIVAGYRAGKIVVFRNSDGAFDDGTVVYEDKANPWTQRVYWHDLDNDGQPELFCAKGPWGSQLGTSLQLVKQDGTAKMKVRWRSSPQTAFHGFEFQDVDNDGDSDVIAADYAHGGNIFLYLSNGGNLAEKPTWSVKTSGPAHEAVLGDIDHDGDLDLAVGCRDQANIYENLTAKGPRKSK